MKNYFGFVYIWYDRKRKMYYIGSHKGTTDDGYICSNKRMKNAYAKRPKDFKRRIIYYHDIDDHKGLFEKEQYWLNFIKDSELTDKYYNVKKAASGVDSETASRINWKKFASKERLKEEGQKVKWVLALHSNSPENRIKNSIAHSGANNIMFGRRHSEETKRLMSEKRKGIGKGIPHGPMNEETKLKLSEAKKGEKSVWYGKHHTEETKAKIGEANTKRVWSEESKCKLSESRKGQRPSEETRKKLSEAQKKRREKKKNNG